MSNFILVIIFAFSQHHEPKAAVQVPMSSEIACEAAKSKALTNSKVGSAFCLRTY